LTEHHHQGFLEITKKMLKNGTAVAFLESYAYTHLGSQLHLAQVQVFVVKLSP
jgi:hypothetical protein